MFARRGNAHWRHRPQDAQQYTLPDDGNRVLDRREPLGTGNCDGGGFEVRGVDFREVGRRVRLEAEVFEGNEASGGVGDGCQGRKKDAVKRWDVVVGFLGMV